MPDRCWRPTDFHSTQGQSVFHNAQELEEFVGGIAKITESDGDFIAAGET